MPTFTKNTASIYIPGKIKRSYDPTIMLDGMFYLDGTKRFRPMSEKALQELELGFTYPTKKESRYTMPFLTDRTYGEGRGRSSVVVEFPTLEEFLTPENVATIRKSKQYVGLEFGTDWVTENGKASYNSAKNALRDVLADMLGIDPDDEDSDEVISLSDTLKEANVLQFTIRKRTS